MKKEYSIIKRAAFITGAALCFLFVSCAAKSAETSSEVKEMSSQGAEVADGALISDNGLPMVVDFTAEWCPPCQELKPIFGRLKDEYHGNVDFVTVNVDSLPQLVKKYNIHEVPALIYLSRDGKEMYRTIGFIPGDSIKLLIANYLN